MLISIPLSQSEDLRTTGFSFSQMFCYVVLSDDASRARVILVFSIDVSKQKKPVDAIRLMIIAPQALLNFQSFSLDNRQSRDYWVPSVLYDKNVENIIAADLDIRHVHEQRSILWGLSYEVSLENAGIDLSLYMASMISTVVLRSEAQLQPVSVKNASVILLYDPQKLKVLSTKSATESIISGSDILESDRVLSDKLILPKKNYMRMMWFSAKPSASSPFHLSAIIQPADPNASSWSETREIVLNLEERLRKLETNVRDIQESIKLIIEDTRQ